MPFFQPHTRPRTSLTLGYTVTIEATKDGIKFAASGDIGNGAVTLRSYTSVDKPEQNIDINLVEPVSLTFSLKYLVNFCKAQGLDKNVKICLSDEVPLLVEYSMAGTSYLRFYLAPKVCFPPPFLSPTLHIRLEILGHLLTDATDWRRRVTGHGRLTKITR